MRRQRAGPAASRASGYDAPIPLTPRGAPCRCCSATGTGPVGATCGSATTATTTATSVTARSSSGGSRPASLRGRTRADDGWVLYRIQGMGIGSYDLTATAIPRSTSRARARTAPVAARRTVATDLSRHRSQARRRRRPGRRPAGIRCPRPPGTRSSRTSTTTGSSTCSSPRATSIEQAEYARRIRSDLFLGQPDGTFVQVAEAAGILDYRARARRCPGRLQPRWPARPRRGRSTRRRSASGATLGIAGTAASPGQCGHWLDVRLTQPGPNRDAIGAWIEVKVGDVTLRRELTVGGGHAGGQLGWIHFGLGPADAAEVRVQWPDGDRRDRGSTLPPTSSSSSSATRPRLGPGRHPP